MDLSKYRYRAVFESAASITRLSQNESARKMATASLAPLAALLPPGVDPMNDPDLLYIAANGAVAGFCNKNDDAVSNQTALEIHSSCRHKYINIDHSREDIAGFILYPGLSRFGTNEPLTEAEAALLKEPFNMSFAGVLWKVVNPTIADYILQQEEGSRSELSMSWEILFDRYNVAVGSRNVFEARIIAPEDPSFAVYDKKLRCNGGEGKDDKGQDVYRVIVGDSILLGYSIVRNPAAAVKGILPIESVQNTPAMVTELSQSQIDTIAQVVLESVRNETKKAAEQEAARQLEKQQIAESQEKRENSQKNSVTINTASIMKIETLEQLETTLGQHEATAAVVDFVKAIKDASEQFSKDLQAKEDLLKNAEQAKAENEKRSKELEASLAEVKKELSEVRAAQEAAQANQKFQDRMASFDEKFDLDAEDRKLIAADVRDLDDAAFEVYAAKCDKLMAAKKKKSKSEMDEEKKKKEQEEEEECEAKKAKAAAEAAAAEAARAKEALASVKEEGGQKVPNSATVDEDLKTKMAAAFGSSILVNGKTINQLKEEKAKKESK